ncbi:gliding motility-associated C-terminal domain-containing protein [Paraflavitalea sp. CAU 1676]|uniref:T9SS type B sorting domain-containing protein n=1 Tax=Paraflavitalea sp. CAU 1676 TaxID=3032598 RepID=UPI0023DB608E|nr:gliding motility-associated C-terminal domain-containing protein [Paraflavitalea sp. CAU 1676]MDF2188255.1 gliding motility-associated C-terminal domain-containing protein [Paraflavitalea sp. CAU 1676]
MRSSVAVFVLILLLSNRLQAQTCTTLGQTPSTAFPVCGTSAFSQANVPICENSPVAVPGCNGNLGYTDKNPFWYRFTCYSSGTLSFLITPNDLSDDYDWMLYDITGKDANDVFTNVNLIVTGNWSGSSGLTGASASGVNFIQCGSNPGEDKPRFAKSPNLIEGHTYLLLVSHFTDSQSGYKLDFGGGTAVITDPKDPALQSASAACGGSILRVKLNKKMKCPTLATNGSDFILSPAVGTIVSAMAIGCNNSFDMDSVELRVDRILPPGNYDIVMKKGSDGNSLKDNCDREIPNGDKVAVTVFPIFPTPMDSIKPVGCAPIELQLVFKNNIRCNSIAANGSDFMLAGAPVTITGASGVCNNGLSSIIKLQLSAPLQRAGTWTIQLVRGSDGNTIIDECGMETPAGATISFTTADTVNADFMYNVLWGCVKDTVQFYHPGANGVNDWTWSFHSNGFSKDQNPSYVFPTFGEKMIRLIVTNGVCSDTANTVVNLDNAMEAKFGAPEYHCPEDMAVFTDSSTGKIMNWNWSFGNGSGSSQPVPEPQRYVRPRPRSQIVTIQLIIENDKNCFDTAYRKMEVVTSCYITVPSAFTPNGDNNNDLLYPLNAFKATNLEFKVYNRYGQIVFETTDWKKRWDGTVNGQKQASGTYVWTLRFIHVDTKQQIFQKGATQLIR